MTAREKLKLEHPNELTPLYKGGCYGCPGRYGYLPALYHGCALDANDELCTRCWDREIPETIIKKEKDVMPISVAKMTKAEMVEEIKCAHEHIREMETKLEDLQKYEKYKDAADEIKAIHTALMDAGFTNEQAFDLLKTTMQSMMPTILRGMSL